MIRSLPSPQPLAGPAPAAAADAGLALPASPLAGLSVVDLVPDGEAALQRFFEANPAYFLAVHGVPAQAAEAHEEIFGALPPGWPFMRKRVFGYQQADGSLAAMANVVVDLLAPGVWHLGTFIVETARHGNGDAQVLLASLEDWASQGGACWMRLAVVLGHARAEAFWAARGYRQVALREGVALGPVVQTVRVLAKALQGQPLSDYYARVGRDRPPSATSH